MTRAAKRLEFKYDEQTNEFVRDNDGELIPDESGEPFRQWRDQIQSPDDIWKEIVKAAKSAGHGNRAQITTDCRSDCNAPVRDAGPSGGKS